LEAQLQLIQGPSNVFSCIVFTEKKYSKVEQANTDRKTSDHFKMVLSTSLIMINGMISRAIRIVVTFVMSVYLEGRIISFLVPERGMQTPDEQMQPLPQF
jgi:hypothetical protein